MLGYPLSVNRPSLFFYQDQGASEVSDELLYGTKLRLLQEAHESSSERFIRCETEYGYSGYLPRQKLSRLKQVQLNAADKKDTETFVVCAVCADLLASPHFKALPVCTLVRGSVLEVYRQKQNKNGYMSVCHHGKTVYVAGQNIRPLVRRNAKPASEKIALAIRSQICEDALAYLGTPYRWGGKSSYGIDCSGLCFMSYFLNGISLWRDAFADRRFVHPIEKSEALKGDLIYFQGHMALYIGDGEYVHATAKDGCVSVASFHKGSILYRPDLEERFLTFARSHML